MEKVLQSIGDLTGIEQSEALAQIEEYFEQNSTPKPSVDVPNPHFSLNSTSVHASQPDFQLSTSPLSQQCPCFTCQNYTSGYLYHLNDVKEMNLQILLGMHNMKQYQLFVDSLGNL